MRPLSMSWSGAHLVMGLWLVSLSCSSSLPSTEGACLASEECVRMSECPEASARSGRVPECHPAGPEPWVCCPARSTRVAVTRRSIGDAGLRSKTSTPAAVPTTSDAPAALPLTLRPYDEALVAIPLLPPPGSATLGSPPPTSAAPAATSGQIAQRSAYPRQDGVVDGDVWFPDARRPPTALYNRPSEDATKRPAYFSPSRTTRRPFAKNNSSTEHMRHVYRPESVQTLWQQDTTRRVWPAPDNQNNNHYNHRHQQGEGRQDAANKQWQHGPGWGGRGTTSADSEWNAARSGGPPSWGPPTIAPRRRQPGKPATISEKKCGEYARLQTERVVALPLVPDPRPSVQHVQKCDTNSVPLVVGGQDAQLHEFPHMAAIGYRGAAQAGPGARIEWNCGGSLISEVFVLTAAHCTATAQGPPIRVRLGEHNLESSEDGARPMDIAVSSMVRHPGYQPPARYHDIGLLRLARKVAFGPAIRPACLHSDEDRDENHDEDIANEPLIAVGWGHTEQLGEKSPVLQKVILNLVNHHTCSNLYSADSTTSSLSRGIAEDSQLCAGVLDGGRDTCQGDSGGPLQVTSPNNRCVFHIVGITSFGKVCAARNSPGVYTRVSKYIPWIERHVWPEERV